MTILKTTTFLHTSDLQLGMTRWFLAGEAQARFDDARLRVIERLGAVAIEQGCEFIVVAGDVFEHNSLNERTTGRALEFLGSLPVPVYLLPGNHDPLIADSIFFRTDGVEGLHVISDSTPVRVSNDVELVGAPLLSKRATTDLVRQAIEPLEATDHIRIMVGHGQAESRSNEIVPDLIDLAYAESKLRDGTIDYLALGDTHSTQAVGTSGLVWFSGAPEATDFHDLVRGEFGGEHNSGNALVVRVDKTSATDASVTVEEVAVGEWTWEALDYELNSSDDVADFLATLDAYPHKDRTVIKYGLRGTLTMTATRDLEVGLEQRRPIFAALFERERLTDLHLEPGEQEIADLAVSGYSAAALAELVESSTTDSAAQDAINLFFRLSKEA